jgi:hypothetical protein
MVAASSNFKCNNLAYICGMPERERVEDVRVPQSQLDGVPKKISNIFTHFCHLPHTPNCIVKYTERKNLDIKAILCKILKKICRKILAKCGI